MDDLERLLEAQALEDKKVFTTLFFTSNDYSMSIFYILSCLVGLLKLEVVLFGFRTLERRK